MNGNNSYPIWTPDGVTVTFTSTRAGAFDLYSKLANLSGAAERLLTSATYKIGPLFFDLTFAVATSPAATANALTPILNLSPRGDKLLVWDESN